MIARRSPRGAIRSIDDIWERATPEPNSGCWLWDGHINQNGYGVAWFGGRNLIASRVAFVLANGPIDDILQVDHLCRVRCCVNPMHLEAVTGSVNIRRSELPRLLGERNRHDAEARVTCKQGHPYTAENTSLNSGGHRYCRACHRVTVAAWEKAHKRLGTYGPRVLRTAAGVR